MWDEWGIDQAMRVRDGLTEAKPLVTPQRSFYLLQRERGKLGDALGKTTG